MAFHACFDMPRVRVFVPGGRVFDVFERCLSNISQTSKTFFMFTNEIERPKKKSTKHEKVWEMCENFLGKIKFSWLPEK